MSQTPGSGYSGRTGVRCSDRRPGIWSRPFQDTPLAVRSTRLRLISQTFAALIRRLERVKRKRQAIHILRLDILVLIDRYGLCSPAPICARYEVLYSEVVAQNHRFALDRRIISGPASADLPMRRSELSYLTSLTETISAARVETAFDRSLPGPTSALIKF